jgi:shikimate kinase
LEEVVGERLRKVLICGHPGSGKSYLLRLFRSVFSANLKNVQFIDLDEALREGNHFWTAQGESLFRKKERELLQQTLLRPYSLVMALGGGALEYNADWLLEEQKKENLDLIFLRSSFEKCWERLQGDPLAFNHREWLKGLTYSQFVERLEGREKKFQQAHYILDADHPLIFDYYSELVNKLLF